MLGLKKGFFDPTLASMDELNRREHILRGEAGSAPADEAMSSAYEYVIAVARHTDSLRSRLAEADEFLAQKKFEASQIAGRRDRDVADLGIAKWVDEVGLIEDGIARYRLALASLWSAVEAVEEARTASERAWINLEQATAR